MKEINQLKLHITFLLILLINIGIEFAYRKPLYDASITLQESFQDQITDAGVFVFKALSQWGNGVPYYLTFIVLYNWESRPRPFYILLELTTTLFIMNTTKMAYHEPRPFMYSDVIIPYGCSSEYGNPSGHSLFAASFNTFIYLDFFHANYGRTYSKITQYIWLFISISLTFLVGFARFYVGVHTINQIMYGWLWGFWIAFYFHFCLRRPVQNHIRSIICQNNAEDVPYLKYVIFSTSMFIIVFMTQITTYIIVDETFTPDPEWIRRIGEKCDVDVATSKQILNLKSVVYSGIPPVSFACYIGILIHRKLFGPMNENSLKTSVLKYILRLLLVIPLAVPFALVFYFISWDSGLVILIIFKTLVPFLCMGSIVFAFSHKIFEKCKLLNNEDLDQSYNYEMPRQQHSSINKQGKLIDNSDSSV